MLTYLCVSVFDVYLFLAFLPPLQERRSPPEARRGEGGHLPAGGLPFTVHPAVPPGRHPPETPGALLPPHPGHGQRDRRAEGVRAGLLPQLLRQLFHLPGGRGELPEGVPAHVRM